LTTGVGRISESEVRDNDRLEEALRQKVVEQETENSEEREKDPDISQRKNPESSEALKRFCNQKGPAVAGLVVLLPITAVLLVVSWLFQKMALLPGNYLLNVTNIYIVNQSLKLAAFLGVGAVIATLTGKIVKTDRGLNVEKSVDRFFSSIPLLGAVHRITKITAETVAGSTKELRKPVKIEIHGMRFTAFKTGNTTADGREILFLPTSPNITTGVVIEAWPEKIIETDETSEQALVRTLSAGFGQHKSRKADRD